VEEMRLDGPGSPAPIPSPSPSSGSDDFAALLDAELLADTDVLEDGGLGSPGIDNGAKSSDLEEDSNEEGSEEEEEESDVGIGEDQEGEELNGETVGDPAEELR